MKKNHTSVATLIAAAAITIGGAALAQSATPNTTTSDAQPKTSTPGAGCTATGNAMSAGNMGGNATNKPCGNEATPSTSAATTAPATTPSAAATTDSSTSSTAAATPSSTDTATAPAGSDTTTSSTRTRVARADRG